MASTSIEVQTGFSGGPVPLEITGEGEWLLITIVAHSTGLLVASRGSNNISDGMPVPVDTPLEILLAPNSRLFVGAPDTNTAFSIIRQPLPFIAQLALAFRSLKLRSAA